MTHVSSPTLSKKRFTEIKQVLTDSIQDQDKLKEAIERFCTIMKFDPDQKIYTKERGQKSVESRRQKAKALGISTYELAKQKQK